MLSGAIVGAGVLRATRLSNCDRLASLHREPALVAIGTKDGANRKREIRAFMNSLYDCHEFQKQHEKFETVHSMETSRSRFLYPRINIIDYSSFKF